MRRARVLTVVAAVLALGLTIPPAQAAEPGPTVVLQNDFETPGTTPWGPRGPVTLTVTGDDAHAGTGSMLVAGRTGDWNGPATNVTTLFDAGTTYTVSAWVKLAPGTTGSSPVHFTVEQTPADNQYAWVGSAVTVTADDWVQVGGTYTKAPGVTAATLYIEAGAIGTTHPDLLVDDVLITAAGGTDPVPGVVPGGAVNPSVTPVSAARGSGDVSALTFDDGPNGATTSALLDFLGEQGIHATFCVIGQNIRPHQVAPTCCGAW